MIPFVSAQSLDPGYTATVSLCLSSAPSMRQPKYLIYGAVGLIVLVPR